MAGSEAVALGKRARDPERVEECPLELTFTPELALAHEDGHINVSPQKKRRGGGHPKGSKNKPKVVGGDQSSSSSGPRRAKRRYTSKRALALSETSGEVVGSGEVLGDGSATSGSSSIFESDVGAGPVGGHGSVIQNEVDSAPPGDTIA